MGLDDVKIHDLILHKDERGWLSEIIRAEQLEDKTFGQITVAVTAPNKVRGNHYHRHKREWFCVVKGTMKLYLKDVKTKKTSEYILSEKKLQSIRVTPGLSHALKNIGAEYSILIIYYSKPYDPKDTDTYPEKVIE